MRAANKTPTKKDVITTTTTENFAVWGWAAPNSFDTRTLHMHAFKIKLILDLFIYYVNNFTIYLKQNLGSRGICTHIN